MQSSAQARVLKFWSYCGLFLVGLISLWGLSRAFVRGGKDFAVFYEAWRLVTLGRGIDVYRVSPDRFLYSPGFAWLFSPLGFLPREIALAIWNGAKLGLLGF